MMTDSGIQPGPNHKPGNSDTFHAGLVTVHEPASPAAEAYRTLRTHLLYAAVDAPPKIIILTSPEPKDGKSITCANLGVVLSQVEKSTLILDCDLRNPQMHDIFGLPNVRGIVDILAQEINAPETWQEPLPNLKVLTAGSMCPTPAEVLSSKRFAEFLEQVREAFDYVLVDTPPLQLVSDPIILATQADGVLLVVNAQSTRKWSVRQSVRSLHAVEANVLGTVVNNVKASRGSGYPYGS